MRYSLVNHGGTILGEVLLAEGVTLQQAGRELVSGRPFRLLAAEEQMVAAAAATPPSDSEKARRSAAK